MLDTFATNTLTGACNEVFDLALVEIAQATNIVLAFEMNEQLMGGGSVVRDGAGREPAHIVEVALIAGDNLLSRRGMRWCQDLALLEVLGQRTDDSGEADILLGILRGKGPKLRRSEIAGPTNPASPKQAVETLRCAKARANRRARKSLRAEPVHKTIEMWPQNSKG